MTENECKKHIVFLFSGQGSHYRGMGRELYEQHPKFKSCLERLDQMVQKQLNYSLIDELYTNTEESFDELLITHPAIVAVEIALYEVLLEMGIKPDFISGNSLGEFAAGVANGVWDAANAVEAAIEQAKSICRADIEGGMMVVFAEEIKLRSLYKQHQLFLASDNFKGHFTLSGKTSHLEVFESKLSEEGISTFRLPVNVPFHSPLMKAAKADFDQYSSSASAFKAPSKGFISGFEAIEINELTADYFWQAISQYSNFTKIIDLLEAKGPCLYIDMGPSGTSAAFVKYNLQPGTSSEVLTIMSPYRREIEQLEKLQQKIKDTVV
ncbi:acyltransferase domain-containing protein [Chryseobacterium proteolyticum]|uniref:acyltransferase domain-containing protein n=1 Tax=Chryseobacterium proteolyticum TaxID=118127 RepID=UPI0039835806